MSSMTVTPDRRTEVAELLAGLPPWAAARADVAAVALVGSWAHRAERMASDVDIMVLTSAPQTYVDTNDWLHGLGAAEPVRTQEWGPVTERRVRRASGLEVEFGFATTAWAATDPVDAGTRRVATDGMRPLWDPNGVLADLLQSLV